MREPLVACSESRESINFGSLTDQQVAFLESTPWHLEAWPGDDDRLRTVWPQIGMFGKWFSRRWAVVPWDFVRPSVECIHNEMVRNGSPTHVWKCARCGYVYGGLPAQEASRG